MLSGIEIFNFFVSDNLNTKLTENDLNEGKFVKTDANARKIDMRTG